MNWPDCAEAVVVGQDETYEGKELRLRQQYFVSASLQDKNLLPLAQLLRVNAA